MSNLLGTKMNTIPFEPFIAFAQGQTDYTVDVIRAHTEDGDMMAICTPDGAIYISKSQAMAFFGLTDTAA